MALQELDLVVVHRSGKTNANTDALSTFPLAASADDNPTCGVVSTITAGKTEEGLSAEQHQDTELADIIQ